MFLGYNTNGFAHHRLTDALTILATLGYRGVALTPDVNHLDPASPDYPSNVNQIRRQLERLGMEPVIETGARFILDPFRKHQPTLISPAIIDRNRRHQFLEEGIRLAVALGSRCVSFWSGTAETDEPADVLMNRLVESCRRLADFAANLGVKLAFEPEPGMFIDRMDRFAELHDRVSHPAFGLTLDVGHLVCTGELPVSRIIREWSGPLWNVHIEDMKPNVHDHLMFGTGIVDFTDVFAALRDVNYSGAVSVELSRHSHNAVVTARDSIAFLRQYLPAESLKPGRDSAS